MLTAAALASLGEGSSASSLHHGGIGAFVVRDEDEDEDGDADSELYGEEDIQEEEEASFNVQTAQ